MFPFPTRTLICHPTDNDARRRMAQRLLTQEGLWGRTTDVSLLKCATEAKSCLIKGDVLILPNHRHWIELFRVWMDSKDTHPMVWLKDRKRARIHHGAKVMYDLHRFCVTTFDSDKRLVRKQHLLWLIVRYKVRILWLLQTSILRDCVYIILQYT